MLGVGLVATLLFLALGLGPGADAHEGDPETRAEVSLSPAGGGRLGPTGVEDAAGVGATGERDRAWFRELDLVLVGAVTKEISHAVERASSISKGKVNRSNVAVAMHVRDLDRRRVIIDRYAQRPMRPASNLKLLTCAAALVLLGPDAVMQTSFEASGPVQDGVLSGDLVVRAGGDPLFREGSDGSLDPWLDKLAADLLTAGVSEIEGSLVLDEGTYPEPAPGPGWPPESQHWQDYCALSGGLTANAGCFTVEVTPTTQGSPAVVKLRPLAHGLPRKGKVTTGAKGSRLDIQVGANAWGVTVKGSIPLGAPAWSASFSHPDPVELFGHALLDGLERRGVNVQGELRRERDVSPGQQVALMTSPVRDCLVPILTHSNNSVADQLFLHLGSRFAGAGNRQGGMEAVTRALDGAGVPLGGWVQVGGSGLSRDNRVSAGQVTALLAAVLAMDDGSADLFRAALPVAGVSGTLKERMTQAPSQGRVHAKTGFINGTSALSGVLETRSGRTLVFSILVEYPTISGLNDRCWKPMQDALCTLMIED